MIDLRDVKNEILWFLRNNDFLTITQRGVTTTTKTDTLTADDSYIIADNKVKNIRSIKVNGELLSLGTHYLLDTENNATILFNDTQTGTLQVIYDTGTADKIYSDFPRDDLKISQYPRIGFEIIAINTEPLSLGGKDFISDILMTLVVYGEKNREVEEILNKIRVSLLRNAKNFYFNKYLQVTGMGRLINDGEYNSIVHRSIDVISRWKTENTDES